MPKTVHTRVPNVNRSGKLHYVGVNALVDDLS
jgi:hypothetical protein